MLQSFVKMLIELLERPLPLPSYNDSYIILILIKVNPSMLKQFAAPFFRRVSPFSFTHLPIAPLSQIKISQKLLKSLEGQIAKENQSIFTLMMVQKNFSELGWFFTSSDALIELSKQTSSKVIKILTKPKNLAYQLQKKDKQDKKAMLDPIHVVHLFASEKGNWLWLTYSISAIKYQIVSIAFIDDYQKQKQIIKHLEDSKQGIMPKSIEHRFQEHVVQLSKEFDFNEEVVKKVCQLCTVFEQYNYVKWAKDLKAVL